MRVKHLTFLWDALKGHEVDFLITMDKTPALLVEAKHGDNSLDPNLTYFSGKIKNVASIQVVQGPGVCVKKDGNIWILSANRFFGLLWG